MKTSTKPLRAALVLLVACGHPQERTADPSPPPSSPRPPSVASCAKDASATDHCRWSIAEKPHCSGIALPPAAKEWECVCNGCESDADCTEKSVGRCTTLGRVCAPAAKVCVYAGEPCADGGRACAEKRYSRGSGIEDPGECIHDLRGHASCEERHFPPPSSGHP